MGNDDHTVVEGPVCEADSSLTSSLRRRLAVGLNCGVDLLFPPGCTVCGSDFSDHVSPREQHLQICRTCLDKLVHPAVKTCPKCGVTLPAVAGSEANCRSCRDHRYRFAGVVSIGRYEKELRDAVLRTKHAAEHALASSLARLLCEQTCERIADWQPHVVAPIPMHRWRRWVRGANHAATIGNELARQSRLKFAARLLVRVRNTKAQMDLAPTQRAKNVRHALRLSRSYSLRAARVLLIDDIMTTGATCNEAARVLLAAGASEVNVAVLGRADIPT